MGDRVWYLAYEGPLPAGLDTVAMTAKIATVLRDGGWIAGEDDPEVIGDDAPQDRDENLTHRMLNVIVDAGMADNFAADAFACLKCGAGSRRWISAGSGRYRPVELACCRGHHGSASKGDARCAPEASLAARRLQDMTEFCVT